MVAKYNANLFGRLEILEMNIYEATIIQYIRRNHKTLLSSGTGLCSDLDSPIRHFNLSKSQAKL